VLATHRQSFVRSEVMCAVTVSMPTSIFCDVAVRSVESESEGIFMWSR
jgi:hypothetical protein